MQPDNTSSAALGEITALSGELRKRAVAMQAELAAITETVQSGDGLATVTVGAGGILRDLRVGGGSAATPERLSRSIMAAYRQGCRDVGRKAADVTERFAPGSPAVAMMREAVPPDPDPEDTGRIDVNDNILDDVRGEPGGWTR